MTDASAAAPAAAIFDAPAEQDRAAPRALTTLFLLALSIVCSGLVRSIFSPVQEMAETGLHLSDFQISQIQGIATAIPTALLAIPIGRLVDRTKRSRLLIAMAVVWTAGVLLVAFAHGFTLLFVARMLSGLGGFCALPIAISMAADLYPARHRGLSTCLLCMGQSVGIALAFLFGGTLAGFLVTHPGALFGEMAPWRSVHIVFGVAAGVMSLPLLLLREPARREVGEAASADWSAVLRELWSRRSFLVPLFIGQIGVVMADVAASVWAAPVLSRNYGQRPEQAGLWMFGAVILSGLAGSVVGGLVADLGQKSRRRGGLMIGAVATSAIAIPATLFSVAPTVPMFAALLTLLLLCGAVMGLITTVALTTLIPNEARGVCLGGFIVVSAIVGIGLAPVVVSLVSEPLGGKQHLAQALSYVDAVIGVISLLAFAVAARHAPPPVAEGPILVR